MGGVAREVGGEEERHFLLLELFLADNFFFLPPFSKKINFLFAPFVCPVGGLCEGQRSRCSRSTLSSPLLGRIIMQVPIPRPATFEPNAEPHHGPANDKLH